MGVSKNNATSKSSISNRVFHYFHHPFWVVKSPFFWINIQMEFFGFNGVGQLESFRRKNMTTPRGLEGRGCLKKPKKSRCNGVTFLVWFFGNHRLHLDVGCHMECPFHFVLSNDPWDKPVHLHNRTVGTQKCRFGRWLLSNCWVANWNF